MVVGMGVVTMPIQDVIPHIQTVSWNVGWGVPHAMKLVPKHTLCPAQRISWSCGKHRSSTRCVGDHRVDGRGSSYMTVRHLFVSEFCVEYSPSSFQTSAVKKRHTIADRSRQADDTTPTR